MNFQRILTAILMEASFQIGFNEGYWQGKNTSHRLATPDMERTIDF